MQQILNEMNKGVSGEISKELLQGFSIEITPRDKKSIQQLGEILPGRQEVFIANLPNDAIKDLLHTASRIRERGMIPVPHIVARNVSGEEELESILLQLRRDAGVENALVIGGDRDDPAGGYRSSYQLIDSGLFQKLGFKKLYIACYPEKHPKIANELLESERSRKLTAIQEAVLKACLISQFAFEAKPIIELAMNLREQGLDVPLRVGLAGPARHGTLIKYAMMCGVGASLRVLRKNKNLTKLITNGYSPEGLLKEFSTALEHEPGLIDGIHLFTFGSLGSTADWISKLRKL